MPTLIKHRSYHDHHEIEGEGIMDILKENFTAERYPGERHAREHLTGRPYNFAGPFTNLSRRLDRRTGNPKPSSIPINRIDEDALRHDKRYGQIADEYYADPTPENRRRKLDEIHNEDDIFIRNVRQHSADDPVVANIEAAAIYAKKKGEDLGVLDSRKFSGFGKKPKINILDDENDPVYKLKQIAMKHNKKYEGGTEQRGGLAPLLIPILASVAGALSSKIFDLIRDKIQGKGYKIPNHKTHKSKKKFFINLVNQI